MTKNTVIDTTAEETPESPEETVTIEPSMNAEEDLSVEETEKISDGDTLFTLVLTALELGSDFDIDTLHSVLITCGRESLWTAAAQHLADSENGDDDDDELGAAESFLDGETAEDDGEESLT